MSLLEGPMFAEHTAANSIEEPIDVVVLVAPDGAALPQQFVDALAAVKARDSAAVLVVFPRVVDAEILQRVADAGANHCVAAPSSGELFAHIERARSLRRYADTDDDPLDAFWRTRSRRG
jgi:hypothetical protein